MSECVHMDFVANVDVARIENGHGEVCAFNAHVRVTCADCGQEFVFMGLPRGVNLDEPVAGAFGIEARLPIRPLTEEDKRKSDTLKIVVPEDFS